MAIDKYKAEKNKWRIPEMTLFLITFLGGGIGTIFGMKKFRHKTQKWYFKYRFPNYIGFRGINNNNNDYKGNIIEIYN